MDDIVKAAILGVVEGLTEFLPISSTGHLILIGDVLGFSDARAASFQVFIQLGAILAVVFLFWHRFVALVPQRSLKYFSQDNGIDGWAGLFKIAIACLPALALGALFHSKIKAYLFAPQPVAIALIVGGILLLCVEKWYSHPRVHTLEKVPTTQWFLLGMFQCLALWPGISRSGSMIGGGMFFGLERRVAAELSFLVAVPIMCAATGYDLWKSWHFLTFDDLPVFAVGFFTAFISAMVAIKFFLKLLARWKLTPFAWYRILLGIGILLFLRGS